MSGSERGSRLRRWGLIAVVAVVLTGGLVGMDPAGAATTQRVGASARVSVGYYHACSLRANGSVRCWGRNTEGQLGNGTFTNSPVPVTVQHVSGAVAISAGAYHSCALLANGTAKCWGQNTDGQLGDNSTTNRPSPAPVFELKAATAITTGALHSCALLATGAVSCWGRNADHQLGDGSTTPSPVPVPVSGLTGVVALNSSAPAANHSCAALVTGDLKCWGRNADAQLGDRTVTPRATPVTVPGITGAIAPAAGYDHSCVVLANGTVKCWGRNPHGQLGNNTIDNHVEPITVLSTGGVVAISAGKYHNCVLRVAGDVRCWGFGSNGQLGTGSGTSWGIPTAVAGVAGAVSVATGPFNSCSALADGAVKCSGTNNYGQLGNPSPRTLVPVPVNGLGSSGVVGIAAASHHSCAVMGDTTVKCWGYNVRGTLGNPTVEGRSTPVPVLGLTGVTAVAAGGSFSCARLAAGTVSCWGVNTYGELGRGVIGGPSTGTASAVPGLTGVKAVAAGSDHACALLGTGTVECWGRNQRGQLGITNTENSGTPVLVPDLVNVVAIDAGDQHTCAVEITGTVKCWGDNRTGEGGTDTTAMPSILTPHTVGGVSGAISVSTGYRSTCAQFVDGTAKCWGSHVYGELGNGVAAPGFSEIPVDVSGLKASVALSSGAAFTCALRASGKLRCWGTNALGELGRHDFVTPGPTPAPVVFLSTVSALAVGDSHSCALIAAGDVFCWGSNNYWELGNGAAPNQSFPLPVTDL